MWKSEVESSGEAGIRKLVLWRGGTRLSYADVVQGWRDDHAFRSFYISLLADVPYAAMFWESPSVTRSSTSQAYEFVLIDSPELSVAQPDASCFVSRFDSAAASESVLTFENLGRDAVLVVPCPAGAQPVYAHLAAFVRGAPEAQRHELFRKLADALIHRLGDSPVWVSTSGLGVYWLHVRLDSRPKYYNFQPYRVHAGRAATPAR